ncbi:hypothetical protein ACSTS3_01310 [Aquimarina muelleri]|uniref:hypothetical protein n=1 Tax=Aquimarina muelleri TaxID=279356 RepID=UPI003F685184
MFPLNKLNFEKTLEYTNRAELKGKYQRSTGEIFEYPKTGNYYNMWIKITENQASIEGSLHKLNNVYNELGDQNFNDFTYCDFHYIKNQMCEELDIDSGNTKLTNLEFGVNIEIDKNPQYILDNNLLMYDYKQPNRSYITGGKDYIQFDKADYSIKVYNKSKQYNLKHLNLIRFELKITNSRYLKRLGIYNLNDLDHHAFFRLYKCLLGHFDKLMIVDSQNEEKSLRIDQQVLFTSGTNPSYWKSLKKGNSNKVINRVKTEFESLIHSNQLDTIKIDLRCKLIKKYHELMNCNDICYSCLESGYRNVA